MQQSGGSEASQRRPNGLILKCLNCGKEVLGKKHPDTITAMEGLAIIDRGSKCKDREAGLQSMPFNSLNTQGSVQQGMAF
jgi:hypothetical protein